MAAPRVGLADAIDTLRAELADAINRGGSSSMPFSVGEIEVELAVVMTLEAQTGVKASFKVLGSGLDVGGKTGGGEEHVHRIRLTLRPAGDGRSSWTVNRGVDKRPD